MEIFRLKFGGGEADTGNEESAEITRGPPVPGAIPFSLHILGWIGIDV